MTYGIHCTMQCSMCLLIVDLIRARSNFPKVTILDPNLNCALNTMKKPSWCYIYYRLR